jgi:hypothetical protein
MTEDLYDEVNHFVNFPPIASCLFPTSYVEQQVLAVLGPASICYVEADYVGGNGYQIGLLWQGGQRNRVPLTINAVLRGLSITASGGAMRQSSDVHFPTHGKYVRTLSQLDHLKLH